ERDLWISAWRQQIRKVVATNGDTNETASTERLVISRSSDDGITWSHPHRISRDANSRGADEFPPALATHHQGHWVLAWDTNAPTPTEHGSDDDILVTTSDDDGLTWSESRFLNTNATNDARDDVGVSITTDSHGKWLAVWMAEERATKAGHTPAI